MPRYEIRKQTVAAHSDASFVLGEEERILTTEPRRANEVVLFIAYPAPLDSCGVCGCEVPCEHGCCGGGGA